MYPDQSREWQFGSGVFMNVYSSFSVVVRSLAMVARYAVLFSIIVCSITKAQASNNIAPIVTLLLLDTDDNGVATEDIMIAAGANHTCAILTDRSVACWGTGYLGNGGYSQTNRAVKVRGISNAKSISAGEQHTCALLMTGQIRCWGDNLYGQLGVGDNGGGPETNPVVVNSINNATSLSAGYNHTCARLSNGNVSCWGRNLEGQLGIGSDDDERTDPALVSDIKNATMVSGGAFHTCATLVTGRVKCWGSNVDAQLGNGDYISLNTPVTVASIENATHVAAGLRHSCARLDDGEVMCWGSNELEELGNGSNAESAIPTPVNDVSGAVSVESHKSHTCARLTNDNLKCWGFNYNGELGNRTNDPSREPTIVSSVSGPSVTYVVALAVTTGNKHSCAQLSSGRVKCWGDNQLSQLGTNDNTASWSAVVTNIVKHATQVSLGSKHVCSLLISGDVECWGDNFSGQLGAGSFGVNAVSDTPRSVLNIENAISIGLGNGHSCAVLKTGRIYCWGRNSFGQLGNGVSGTGQISPVATQVVGVENAVGVAGGGFHSCAVAASGRVWCWGWNQVGQLGNDDLGVNSSIPALVLGISNALEISSGVNHTCARLDDGRVQCWGSNYSGQLGNSEVATTSAKPVFVTGINNAISLSVSGLSSCVILRGGSARCWGANRQGQLGNGESGDDAESYEPVIVEGIENAASVSISGEHSCALLVSGGAKCWGDGSSGQLGDGSNGDDAGSSIPIFISRLENAVSLSLGGDTSCAILLDGRVKCWGANASGQLGIGSLDAPLKVIPTDVW